MSQENLMRDDRRITLQLDSKYKSLTITMSKSGISVKLQPTRPSNHVIGGHFNFRFFSPKLTLCLFHVWQLDEIYRENHLRSSWACGEQCSSYPQQNAQSQVFFQPLDCNSTLQIG